eukprot:SAG31_NODE_1572_length_7850_cov_28.848794_6_plen_104_part_00
MPILVRHWFVLYGLEAMVVPPGRYKVVMWVWAAMVVVMQLARSRNAQPSATLTKHARFAIFTSTLKTACRMDLFARCIQRKVSGPLDGVALQRVMTPTVQLEH